jgi:YfiH family protein
MVMIPPQPSGGFQWTQAPWGQALECLPLLDVAPHVFTVRNLQLREDPSEWQAVADAMKVGTGDVLLIRQVHRTNVAVVRRGRNGSWPRPEADAIVSDDPSAAIGVRVADCAPILIADRTPGGPVAAVHAGWRGTVQRAAIAGVRRLTTEFGSKPSELVAAIGPCLGPCCGEVGGEVVEAFKEAGHSARDVDAWFSPGPSGRPHIDLWRANHDQLADAGIPLAQIHVAALCTRTYPDWLHSYRVDGANAGRMLAAIRCRGRANQAAQD